jgi:hypothetical protein
MAGKAFPITVHPFPSPTPSSCAYERGLSSSRNALVHIGGLTSGPHTSPQLDSLVKVVQADIESGYSFWEFRMRSSYTGFGYSSLANDVEDISTLVRYLRSLGKEKIVLLGSSTGKSITGLVFTRILIPNRMPGHSHICLFQLCRPTCRCIHTPSANFRSRDSQPPHVPRILLTNT